MAELNGSKFFHHVTGERARELLFLYGSKGEFLVRPSESNPYDHTISIHRGTRVTHVKLTGRGGIHRLPTGDEFLNLNDLVQHLMDTPNLLYEKDGVFIEVQKPVQIPASENVINIGHDRFFHIGISGQEAEEMLRDEPNGTFLIRESASIPGEYALSVKNEDATCHVRIYRDEGNFRIVANNSFRSLAELIDNYMKTPMVQFTGTPVRLKQPLLSARFTAASVDDRIDCLIKTAKKSSLRDGIADEFDKIHHDRGSQLFISCKEGRRPDNVRKNRYRNVVPYDHTRIKLKPLDIGMEPGDEPFSDYINANLVEVLSHSPAYTEFAGVKKRYISTQGCLQHTIGDFWHMVWQENVRVIVMTTKEMERGRMKCCRYWPEPGEEVRYGAHHQFRVKTAKEEYKDEYVVRLLELALMEKGETVALAVRHVWHFQFLGWEDNGCPSASVLSYLDDVNRCQEGKCPAECGPMLVHCSAGIGRTGTFIVLDIIIARIKQIGAHCPIDIPKTIRMVREQRATMVQTEAQYRFIYYAISNYMKTWRKDNYPLKENLPSVALPIPPSPEEGVDPDDELECNEEAEEEDGGFVDSEPEEDFTPSDG